jgi:hypothetical protein
MMNQTVWLKNPLALAKGTCILDSADPPRTGHRLRQVEFPIKFDLLKTCVCSLKRETTIASDFCKETDWKSD